MATQPQGDHLQPDGTIVLQFERVQVRLRRPKNRELQDLMGKARQVNDQTRAQAQVSTARQMVLRDRRNKVRDQMVEQIVAAKTDTEREQLDAQMAEQLHDLSVDLYRIDADYQTYRDGMVVEWLLDAIGTLKPEQVGLPFDGPDHDEFPAWLYDDQMPGRWLTHWKTVPSHAGPG